MIEINAFSLPLKTRALRRSRQPICIKAMQTTRLARSKSPAFLKNDFVPEPLISQADGR
jgi:hypothetical protein